MLPSACVAASPADRARTDGHTSTHVRPWRTAHQTTARLTYACWVVFAAEGSCVEESQKTGAGKKGGFLSRLFKKKTFHADVPDLPPCSSSSDCLDTLHAHHASFAQVLSLNPPPNALVRVPCSRALTNAPIAPALSSLAKAADLLAISAH